MKKILLVLSIFLFHFDAAFGIVIKTNNLSPFVKEMDFLNKNDLVLWDVDDTLITPEDAVLQTKHRKSAHKLILEMQPFTSEKYSEEYLISTMLGMTRYQLIDKTSSSIIKNLQKRGIPTLAITAANMNEFGVIPNLADWRVQQLKDLDIDFTSSFPYLKPMTFQEINNESSSPGFKKRSHF